MMSPQSCTQTWLPLSLTLIADGVRVQREVSSPVPPQLIVEGGDPPADVLMRCSLQEKGHPLSRQAAETANPGWGRGL